MRPCRHLPRGVADHGRAGRYIAGDHAARAHHRIVAEIERSGEEVARDPFGHVKIDKVNPGAWFASKFAERLDAQKVMVQKSGYFSRSAAASAISASRASVSRSNSSMSNCSSGGAA